MSDEWNEHYDKLRDEIESLSAEEKKERIENLSKELFIIANSFAGDETGHIAIQLHKASNAATRATLLIEDDDEALNRYDASAAMSAQTEMMYNILKITQPEIFEHED